MAFKHRFNNNRKRFSPPPRAATIEAAPVVVPVRARPTVYGKPFIILEDENHGTFEYRSGAWVTYSMTIAQCRDQGKVKDLAQKINGMRRYEVRLPVTNVE